MFKKYMPDYYALKIGLSEICKKENVSQSTFYRFLEKNNMLPRRKYYGLMGLGNDELNRRMKDRYAGIVKRCNNARYSDGNYEGLDYMPIYEWIEFCNDNKTLLLNMWDIYLKNDKDERYSISVDRLNNDKGYTKDNVQFVTHGFNAWKRNLRPIEVNNNGKKYYFLSCEEGSRFFGLRRQYIGEYLNGIKSNPNYEVNNSTVSAVLKENNTDTLDEYYERFLLKITKPVT